MRWLNLGAGAGPGDDESGLSLFKRGWSTGARQTYFCGRVFDHARYNEISSALDSQGTGYFPVYRSREFG
jgi:hypothetical protein